MMKKKLTTAAITLGIVIGTSITAFAYSKEAVISSATDSNGTPVTASFTLDDSVDLDLINEFWDLSEAEQESIIAYYGYEDLASSPYANGSLNLSQTGASTDNPVTLTFSLTSEWADFEWTFPEPKAGKNWLYVLQKSADGSSKLIPARSDADNTITAQFTDSGVRNILIVGLDLARSGMDAEGLEDIKEVGGVQSAVDAEGNAVNVTVSSLDEDRKLVALNKSYELFWNTPFAAAEVNLEGSSVSADNPVTVTFSLDGVVKDETIAVLHKKANGEWETLTGTTGDGTVTVTFTSLSPVAFVRPGTEPPMEPSEPTESSKPSEPAKPSNTDTKQPEAVQTSDTGTWNAAILAALAVTVSAIILLCNIKKKQA